MKNETIPVSDYAIVLGAASYGGTPSPAFQRRIEKAIDLYREKKIAKIIFTGKPGDPPQALVARRFAMNRGVPDDAILVETRSTTTFENLKFARETIPSFQNSTALIVSEPLHLKRAMLMAKDLGWKASPAPLSETVYKSPWQKTRLLTRETLAFLKYRLIRLFS